MLPLHHGDGVAEEDANWFQQVNDSDSGLFLGSLLHTLGALLFAAGIVLFLYLGHLLRKGGTPAPRLALLGYAQVFTLVGILFNGLGGLMRLYQSDHPGLERLDDSTWVQVLFVKHLFLIAGVVLAGWLTWRTLRLDRADAETPPTGRDGTRMIGYSIASAVTILLATVLGVMAGNIDLAADLGVEPLANTTTNPGDGGAGPNLSEERFLGEFTTSGEISSYPAGPAQGVAHQFAVPADANRVVVVLRWSSEVAQLSFRVFDAAGDEVSGDLERLETTLTMTIAGDEVRSGQWTVRVRGEQAVEEAYSLRMTMLSVSGGGNLIDRTVTINPGRFYEANLLMTRGESLRYDWEVVNSTAKIYFDIHFHPTPTEVTYAVQGDWNELVGNYTHGLDDAGASLLWENSGDATLTIRLVVRGDFTVHSYAGP